MTGLYSLLLWFIYGFMVYGFSGLYRPLGQVLRSNTKLSGNTIEFYGLK